MAEIRLENLHKAFGDFTAVRESSFTIADGEFFVMLGPSGCGKTTTLRMIAGLELPTSGRILLDGEDVTWNRASARDIAFVFQLFALYPHMTVRRNISFPLRIAGLPRKEVRERTESVAKLLQIEHLLDRGVGGLAAGDRQRVALGRAIVRRAKAFLMDEPLGALDAEFRDVMCEELRVLHNRIGATTVYVTHDQVEAMSMADRICVMNHAEVLQIGSPLEVYDRPATKFVAGFIGSPSMNFLPAKGGLPAGSRAIRVNGSEIAIPETQASLESAEAFVGARPEHIQITGEGALRGRVFGVEYMGARQLVTVDTDVGRLRVRSPNTLRVNDGETVGLDFMTERLAVFDAATDRAVPTLRAEGGLNG
ncbi:ATP-binding cassette domain-containing protein [Stappia sp. GBMRC 2046]|uniref:ATP-binding cassette domain-containing protein n=1 Tax=Stappia sediminis TaxID=2692190 RepID=A0A7X3LSM3_9HYPH|nr:ABC transporter ATP-binding protein [Stappia sediminis]MXN64370.1 ATP-binding cassette domain-containing protein [Stappia sediminis]